MTKSPASQLIEQVSKGMSPQRAITEEKLAAVDPQLAKVRDKAIDSLLDAAAGFRKIKNEVTIRSIAQAAGSLYDQIKKLSDESFKL